MNGIKVIVDSRIFQWAIIGLIFINAGILALDALPDSRWSNHQVLLRLDDAILWVFVSELILRFLAHGRRFFADSWSIFDLLVVGISFLPLAGGFAALRAFRVFRILRLVSAFPKLRRVVAGLLGAIPGIGSVALLMVLIVFVASILATNLFGAHVPHYFGDLWTSMYTLFKVMTMEGWPEISDATMAIYPWAWVFFVTYILVATLTLMNFFVAIVVNSMEEEALKDKATISMQDQLLEEIQSLRGEIDVFREQQKKELDDIEKLLEKADKGRN